MKELTTIQNKIYEIRGQQVMLDFDLAALYQVETKRLKEAVRRNIERFEGGLEVANCDLKLGWYSLSAICIHGIGRCHVIECFTQ